MFFEIYFFLIITYLDYLQQITNQGAFTLLKEPAGILFREIFNKVITFLFE